MIDIPDLSALEDLWVDKLKTVDGLRSAFSVGQLEELGSERVFRMPAAMVMFTGAPADQPEILGRPAYQEGTMSWSIFIYAESMRGQNRGRGGDVGAFRLAKATQEAVIGWEIKEGWRVYYVDLRPFDAGESSKTIYELLVAHQFDMTGN